MHTSVTVLDLGFGSGGNTNEIAKSATGNVLAIDISNKMIADAKRKYHKSNLEFKKPPWMIFQQ